MSENAMDVVVDLRMCAAVASERDLNGFYRAMMNGADEIERLRAHVEALQQKIDADKSCACAYDSPDDVCLPHSPVVADLRAENARLRAALAQSDQPCAYCSLPAVEWAQCASGFPGCDRADDAMGCPELGAALERDQLRTLLNKYREAVRIDPGMSGPRFAGSDVSALKRAWDADRDAIQRETTVNTGS